MADSVSFRVVRSRRATTTCGSNYGVRRGRVPRLSRDVPRVSMRFRNGLTGFIEDP